MKMFLSSWVLGYSNNHIDQILCWISPNGNLFIFKARSIQFEVHCRYSFGVRIFVADDFICADRQTKKQTNNKIEARLCSENKQLEPASLDLEAIKFLKLQSIKVL